MAIGTRHLTRLVIPVPELRDVLSEAHVTLLDPFLPASDIDAGVLAELREFFSELVPFAYVLGEPARFPSGRAYLPPRPVGVFRRITHGLRRTFPEVAAPAGSLYAAIPHVTVPDEVLDDLLAALTTPLEVHARDAQLIHDDPETGVTRETFAFGTSAA